MVRFWGILLAILLITSGCIYLPAGTLGGGGGGGAPTITSFSVSPASIAPGGVATLSWSVTGATSVSIDQGIGNVAISGTRAVSPAANTVYTLTAGNGTSSTTATTSIFVSGSAGGNPTPSGTGLPTVNSFVANPPIVTPGGGAILTWDVGGATSIVISPGVGPVGPTGSMSVLPGTSTAYILTATNGAGSTTASATVLVQSGSSVPPPIVLSFTSNPAGIVAGNPSTLTWNVYGANSITIDQGVGNVGSSGSAVVHPGSSITYTLTATNSAGAVSASTDVNVLAMIQFPVIQYFTANPSSLFKGASSTLAWQTTSAAQATLNGSPVSTSGAKLVTPAATSTYTLSASNAFGNTSKTISVTVLFINPNLFKQLQVVPLGP